MDKVNRAKRKPVVLKMYEEEGSGLGIVWIIVEDVRTGELGKKSTTRSTNALRDLSRVHFGSEEGLARCSDLDFMSARYLCLNFGYEHVLTYKLRTGDNT